MARRYRRRRKRSGGNLTATVMKFARLSAILYPPVKRASDVWNAEHDMLRTVSEGLGALSGFQDGVFDSGRLINNWTPYVMTSIATYGVGKLNGLIRKLKIG